MGNISASIRWYEFKGEEMTITSRPLDKNGQDTWDRVFGIKKVANKTYIYYDGRNNLRCSCGYGDVKQDAVKHIYFCTNCLVIKEC